MTTGFKFCSARRAISSFALAALLLPGGSFATPLYTAPSDEEETGAVSVDEFLPEVPTGTSVRPASPDAKTALAALDLGEIALDGIGASRRLKPDFAVGGRFGAAPGAPASDEDMQLMLLFRQVINVNVEAGLPRSTGRERLRRPGNPAAGLSELEFVTAAEAMVKEAVVNALEKGVVSLALADLGDITLTLGTDHHTLYVGGSEWLTLRDTDAGKSAMRMEEARYTGSSAGYGLDPVERPVVDESNEHVSQFLNIVREFLTDPITIIAVLGWFILWNVFESVRSSRRRGPRRRSSGSATHSRPKPTSAVRPPSDRKPRLQLDAELQGARQDRT